MKFESIMMSLNNWSTTIDIGLKEMYNLLHETGYKYVNI